VALARLNTAGIASVDAVRYMEPTVVASHRDKVASSLLEKGKQVPAGPRGLRRRLVPDPIEPE